MTKHELDKIAARALNPLSQTEINLMVDPVAEELKNATYIMLLSKEISYYTIFKVHPLTGIKTAVKKIFSFIQTDSFLTKEIGSLVHIETNDQFTEIWIGETHFALFECSSFIVNI